MADKDGLRGEYSMRKATKEENDSVNKYIQNISKPTGVSFDEAIIENNLNENISDCLIIGFDKHKGEQTWMSVGRQSGEKLDIINMIKDERAEILYKQLLTLEK